jgi:DNA-binding NtrC family response regulator
MCGVLFRNEGADSTAAGAASESPSPGDDIGRDRSAGRHSPGTLASMSTTDAIGTPRSRLLGLVTRDEELVESLGAAMRASLVQLLVGPTHAELACVLSDRSVRLCVLDRPAGTDELLLEIREGEARHSGRLRVCYAYRRDDLAAVVRHIRALVPPVAGDAGDALARIRGESSSIELVREQIRGVAKFGQVSVMILGETGTGKELVARALHEATFGPKAAFVAINCAAIPEALLESELFGHEAGAYTGARGVKSGLFEAASGGTVFLDEVGEMPVALQAKLLRVLESGEFRRVGSNRPLRLNARVLSATNQNPWAGTNCPLRADITYRLAGFTIRLPPLRERASDVDDLSRHFLRAFERRYGTAPLEIDGNAMELLRAHCWPGNVRELRAIVEHAAIVASHGTISAGDIRVALAPHQGAGPGSDRGGEISTGASEPLVAASAEEGDLPALERRLILAAVARSDGNISRAARQLGLPRSTLRSRLERIDVGGTPRST